MLQVRRSVFETNSSSTHSLTICSKDEYEGWVKGEYYWSEYGEKLIPKSEVEKEFQEFLAQKPTSDSGNLFNDYLCNKGLYTFEEFEDMGYYETYEKEYTLKSGDGVVAFGYYGYSG